MQLKISSERTGHSSKRLPPSLSLGVSQMLEGENEMKRISLILMILLGFATNVTGEVLFVKVGGPIEIRKFEVNVFQHNESVKTVQVQVSHNINGEYYYYTITPILKENLFIKSALVQFKCKPIRLKFDKRNDVISKDKKSIRFIYGISEKLKEEMVMKVTLGLDDESVIVFNLNNKIENKSVKEIVRGRGGIQLRDIFRDNS